MSNRAWYTTSPTIGARIDALLDVFVAEFAGRTTEPPAGLRLIALEWLCAGEVFRTRHGFLNPTSVSIVRNLWGAGTERVVMHAPTDHTFEPDEIRYVQRLVSPYDLNGTPPLNFAMLVMPDFPLKLDLTKMFEALQPVLAVEWPDVPVSG